jgi:hypothetical protein
LIDHPPPRKSERNHANIDYTVLDKGDTISISPHQHAYNAFFEGDFPRKFAPDRFLRMDGNELTKLWAEETGCKEPVVIPHDRSEGLEMTMPGDLTVRKVAELVGHNAIVDVIGKLFSNLYSNSRCSKARGERELEIKTMGRLL